LIVAGKFAVVAARPLAWFVAASIFDVAQYSIVVLRRRDSVARAPNAGWRELAPDARFDESQYVVESTSDAAAIAVIDVDVDVAK